MDFADSPDEATFRADVRAWLAGNAGAYVAPPLIPWSETELVARGRAWLATKADAGYAAITWPKELGGRGGSAIEAMIFAEEESRYHLPIAPFATIGMNMAMPAILKHGTPEQVSRFAQATRTGELIWCQLFSEPGAGSDLAAVRTRAVRNGDRWIVNGQKVWSSWAHHADWGILLARTDAGVPKHKGLGFFLVDMTSPGIDIRPIRQINGKSDFNETFLTDLVIPDTCRLGGDHEGWAVAMTVLTGERLNSGEEAGGIRALIDIARAMPLGTGNVLDAGSARERLATLYAREQGERFLRFRLLTRMARGEPLGAEAAAIKLVYASRLQQASGFGLEMAGFASAAMPSAEKHKLAILEDYMWAPAMRIAGGADEVLRNQIAERVLGMPGDLRLDKDVPFDALDRRDV
jgi:acyl-CoA dehydrogenase